MPNGSLSYLEWSREVGKDVRKDVPINFDPKAYKEPSEAAYALHAALVDLATAWGQSASEVAILRPEASEKMGTGRNWRVIWEAGPHQWAIMASFWVNNHAAGWYTEPYYNFDLCFEEM